MVEIDGLLGNAHIPSDLVKLGTFQWPRSEARQTLGHLFEKIKVGLMPDVANTAIDTEKLKSVSEADFENSACDLLAATLRDLLDQTYHEWANTPKSEPQRRAFVHPPMKDNILCDWAEWRGLPILRPGSSLDDFVDANCVVIPKLEAFFSRDHTKLGPLFDLFADLTRFEGKVIVGCNSWAWRFLKQFDDALLLFDDASTLPVFSANALAAILENALPKTSDPLKFVSVQCGEPVLQRDEDGELFDPYLEDLAGCSLGQPTVAIEMFFRGIAEAKETEDDASGDRIWVNLPTGCTLPVSGADALLFALHALVIHGSRPITVLNDLLPHRAPNGVWTDLNRMGFVEIHDSCVHIAMCSYPDIRNELGAAGFNLDEL